MVHCAIRCICVKKSKVQMVAPGSVIDVWLRRLELLDRPFLCCFWPVHVGANGEWKHNIQICQHNDVYKNWSNFLTPKKKKKKNLCICLFYLLALESNLQVSYKRKLQGGRQRSENLPRAAACLWTSGACGRPLAPIFHIPHVSRIYTAHPADVQSPRPPTAGRTVNSDLKLSVP